MSLLYEDEFVAVNDFALKIKNYHFPSKKIKSVPVEVITVVWFEEQETSKCATRVWGKSPSGVYWALDVKRSIPCTSRHRYNVVLELEQKNRLGFTVSNGKEFMDAMRAVLDYHVIIVDHINV